VVMRTDEILRWIFEVEVVDVTSKDLLSAVTSPYVGGSWREAAPIHNTPTEPTNTKQPSPQTMTVNHDGLDGQRASGRPLSCVLVYPDINTITSILREYGGFAIPTRVHASML
jgi:hypothetical protein